MTTDLRYPIGPYVRPSASSDADRGTRIAAIEGAPAAFRAATAGLTDAQLDTPYRPDGWTVRQVVHHVADSHVNAYARVRLCLTESNPTIKPYDEVQWAELPDARTLPIASSLAILDGLHHRWTVLAQTLIEADYARTVFHPANGAMTLDAIMEMYAWHSKHHAAHITTLRARNGW
jgi:hypothetical protein